MACFFIVVYSCGGQGVCNVMRMFVMGVPIMCCYLYLFPRQCPDYLKEHAFHTLFAWVGSGNHIYKVGLNRSLTEFVDWVCWGEGAGGLVVNQTGSQRTRTDKEHTRARSDPSKIGWSKLCPTCLYICDNVWARTFFGRERFARDIPQTWRGVNTCEQLMWTSVNN